MEEFSRIIMTEIESFLLKMDYAVIILVLHAGDSKQIGIIAEYPIVANSETLFPCYVGVALRGTRTGGDASGTL